MPIHRHAAAAAALGLAAAVLAGCSESSDAPDETASSGALPPAVPAARMAAAEAEVASAPLPPDPLGEAESEPAAAAPPEIATPSAPPIPGRREKPTRAPVAAEALKGRLAVDLRMPERAPGAPPLEFTGPARIRWSGSVIDFGAMLEEEVLRARVEFRNEGGEPLRITDVTVTCGCTAAELEKKVYAPGEIGALELSFDPPKPGTARKQVMVSSNDLQRRVSRLSITAEVTAVVALDPVRLMSTPIDWRSGGALDVTVTPMDESFTYLGFESDVPWLTVASGAPGAPDARGRRPWPMRIEVAPDAPWGVQRETVAVVFEGTMPGYEGVRRVRKEIDVPLRIQGDVAVMPPSVRFGGRPGERFERTITVSHEQGEPFTILSAVPAVPGIPELTVTPTRRDDGGWTLRIAGRYGDAPGAFPGRLLLRTDVAGEEEIPVDVLGRVR